MGTSVDYSLDATITAWLHWLGKPMVRTRPSLPDHPLGTYKVISAYIMYSRLNYRRTMYGLGFDSRLAYAGPISGSGVSWLI